MTLITFFFFGAFFMCEIFLTFSKDAKKESSKSMYAVGYVRVSSQQQAQKRRIFVEFKCETAKFKFLSKSNYIANSTLQSNSEKERR